MMSTWLARFQPESCFMQVSSKNVEEFDPTSEVFSIIEGPQHFAPKPREWSSWVKYKRIQKHNPYRTKEEFENTKDLKPVGVENVTDWLQLNHTGSSWGNHRRHFLPLVKRFIVTPNTDFEERRFEDYCRTGLAFATSAGMSPRKWSEKSTT